MQNTTKLNQTVTLDNVAIVRVRSSSRGGHTAAIYLVKDGTATLMRRSEPRAALRAKALSLGGKEGRMTDPLRYPRGYPNGSPRTYRVRVGGETFTAEDDGRRREPGTPVPRDRRPDALLALARNAEAHERHLNEEREGKWREGRRAA